MGQAALITGSGALPAAVARAMDAPPLVCSLSGHTPEGIKPDLTFRLEHLGSLIETLKSRDVTEVCFCGAVTRPEIDPAAIDAATKPLIPALQRALQPGDDGALRAIISVFEEAGFAVKGAHEIAPALLPPLGDLTRKTADEGVRVESVTARAVLQEMARIDEGQACVLRGETVLAREDTRGTDAMLADLAAPRAKPLPSAADPFNWVMDSVAEALDDTADWLAGAGGEKAACKGAGGVLFKAPKPGQDRRADLPTIGPETVRGAARAGLRGIVIEAGGVIVLDRDTVIRLCDEAGLFLSVRAVL
ncbi:LpxI family protein [Aestuariivita boseongensis]|uniref:LpxI family protein n=1 Tax=Aestuariivita boseongensis TaxID=1470562 RepID=UPI0006837F8F|nr:UDP-2,3-diacylglucosamine diphosphatase LpxI [Aestuariivita boseongensis]